MQRLIHVVRIEAQKMDAQIKLLCVAYSPECSRFAFAGQLHFLKWAPRSD
jgi:hypothetical protein